MRNVSEAEGSTAVLPAPAAYAPYRKGLFEVTPGLHRLGKDFGNGAADGKVFQIDRDFARYRRNKTAVHARAFRSHCGESNLPAEIRAHTCAWLAGAFAREQHENFSLAHDSRHWALECRLTGERLRWDDTHTWVQSDGPVAYESVFDALAMQVQEDVAVVALKNDRDWVAAVHVMAPNHWAPDEILGRPFSGVHEPVPGMEATRARGHRLMQAMAEGKPYVRFVWGIVWDAELNHHPAAHAATEEAGAPMYVRIERQCLVGLPEVSSILFTIRTYVTPADDLAAADRAALASGVRSMTAAQRAYKRLDACYEQVLARLEG